MYLAYDHGMEHGISDFDEKSIDPAYVLDIAEKAGFSAVVLQKGLALEYWKENKSKTPLILKLNGKTNLYKGEALA
ncbi:MAG: aldolase, partial [Patescibacteria group bacterium]